MENKRKQKGIQKDSPKSQIKTRLWIQEMAKIIDLKGLRIESKLNKFTTT